MNPNVAAIVGSSRVDDTSSEDDDWSFESAVGLFDVERLGIKRQFQDLQESCRINCRDVADAVPLAVEVTDELVKQVGEQGTQGATNAGPAALLSEGTEVVPL